MPHRPHHRSAAPARPLPPNVKTAILGAGVSGLALARFLVERGRPLQDLHLFEAAAVAGGLCGSKTVDGFTYDVAGGHILFSKDRAAMQWMKDGAGGDRAFVQRDRHTKIRFGDRWVHYPFENGLGDLPQQANFDCLEGYVRAWHERDKHGTRAPADFAGWVRWRFGEGIARHFMDPYNAKIWKRPLNEITSEWVAGRVPDAPVEDVLKAAIGMRTEGYVHQAIFYYPVSGGFQAITDGLYAGLRAQVRLSTPVERVQAVRGGYKVNGESFDQVVSTLPLNLLPGIVEDLPAGAAQAMAGLAYNSITCVLLALDRPEHPNLSWIYLPHEDQGPANRVTYMSNYSPGNAPAGRTSLMCEITFPGGAPEPGPELEAATIDGLVHAGLLERRELLFTDRHSSRFAYIVYDFEFAERKRTALAALEALGIHPLGRFGKYEYHNSDQCVIEARSLADRLVAQAARG
jgi:protoporphyrinogen oxidase